MYPASKATTKPTRFHYRGLAFLETLSPKLITNVGFNVASLLVYLLGVLFISNMYASRSTHILHSHT